MKHGREGVLGSLPAYLAKQNVGFSFSAKDATARVESTCSDGSRIFLTKDSRLHVTGNLVAQIAGENIGHSTVRENLSGNASFQKTRMKTEERNSANLPRVRIAVLGMINVGKSALTVRYLTRRYIGEYRSNTGKRTKVW
ncbi:hypothetical protein J6590_076200 [Homalodisca vitripennis]|nr:hypothetical protein J6590_076200 [Homalodisca vitripennis]